MNTSPALTVGMKVRIEKGCKARDIAKNVTAVVTVVHALGADYSHQVRVQIKTLNGFGAGKLINLYVRHQNRLTDAIVRMNDGNPLHVIEVSRKTV